MDCEYFAKEINSYIDGELDQNESSELEKHLESCRQCRADLMSFEKCKSLLHKFARDKNPPSSIKKYVFKQCGCFDKGETNCCSPNEIK
jgi:anti-sigma factor RsiW